MNKFGCYDIFISSLSCVTYITDVGTDVGLIVYLFINGYQIWAALALTFVAMATLMMQVFSFHWHITDRTMSCKVLVIHLLFIAPIHRYIRCLKLGKKFRDSCDPEDLKAAHSEINDVGILRLFQTFLESAPMLILQLYIIFTDTSQFGALICISSCFSLLSMAWSLTAYTDALHIAYEKFYKRTALSIISQTLWQLGMVASRVFAIVLFATVFQGIVMIPLGFHLVLMIVWIAMIRPDFGTTPCQRHLFTLVSAIIHTFCFLNFKDGPSRWRMLVFYVIILIENSVLIVIWFVYRHIGAPEYLVPMGFSVVFGGFAFGVLVMLLYYGCCHPSGPAPIPARKPEFHKPPAFVDQSLKTRLPVFDESVASARINQWLSASMDLSKEGLCENPVDGYTSLQTHGNLGDDGDHGYSRVIRSPADVHRSEQNMAGTEPSPDSGTNLMGNHSLQALYLENYCQSPRSGVNRPDDRLNHSHGHHSRFGRHLENEILSVQDRARNDGAVQSRLDEGLDHSPVHQSRFGGHLENEILSVQDCAGNAGAIQSRLDTSHPGQDYDCEVNDSRTSQVRLGSGQSAQKSSSRVNYDETSQRRSELDRSLTEMVDTNQNIPNHNLVEMLSKCNLDPCYVSDSSVNDSVFHISPVFSPGRENSVRGNILSSVNSDSKHNDISRSGNWNDKTPTRSKDQEFKPTNISPLDPLKLWEESQNRMGLSPGLGQLFYQPSPDHGAGYQSDVDKITLLPDESQGISHLSMSYTTLENNELGSSSDEQLKSNQSHSDNSQTVFYSKGRNRSDDSVNFNQSHLNKSNEITFSNMSLPLPDSSYNPNKSQRSMSHSSQGQGQSSKNSSSFLGYTSDSTPHSYPTRDRSLSSYRDNSSPGDQHSSYSSDKGLSLSDRAMTSGSDSYERSQRSFTSSGFQSEESNMSNGSPTYMNQSGLKSQYHTGGLLENEIMSMRMADESALEAVHRSVFDEDLYNQSVAGQNQSATFQEPLLNTVGCVDSISNRNAPERDIPPQVPDIQSPLSLPPLLSRRSSMSRSSAGSSTSGRFFKDPTLPDDSENSSEESQYPQSTDSSLRRSQYNEKSSLSAMISDMSSSKCGDFMSSDGSLSIQSDRTMSSMSENKSGMEFNKTRSLPYTSQSSSNQDNKSYFTPPVYENVDQYQKKDSTFSPGTGEPKYNTLPPNLSALSRENTDCQGVTYMNLPKGRREYTKVTSNRGGELQRAHDTNLKVEEYDDSPHGLGRNVDLFNRDKWRASLDKAMRDRLQSDLEKMAPKKLYQLQSKNAKKKIPPMEVAEYNESPYKFRKPGDNVAKRNSSTVLSDRFDTNDNNNYENIGNVSRIKDSGVDHSSPNYLNLPPDYENVFNSQELLCPMARPESLTASISSGRNSAENFKSNVCSPLYSPMETGHVRAELFLESLSSVSDSLSSRSDELSRTKSPINTTGINSAFKPVISKTKSIDSLVSKPDTNKTFTVLNGSNMGNSMSDSKDFSKSNVEQSSLNNSSKMSKGRSDVSRSGKESDLSLDQSSFSRKTADKSRRRSDVSRSTDHSELSIDQGSYSRKSADKSRRRSDISQNSYGREGNNSTFPYSSDESSLYTKSSHSFNYLDYVGYPENYKSLNIAAEDYSKSRHSPSDSIQWEDSVNKSLSFQNDSNLSVPRSAQRQPLKGLENTPTFSPIYGGDLRRQSLEMLARKRFMSTPKLSSGSDLSLSRNSNESGSSSRSKSKNFSASSRVFDMSDRENTSTWGTQQSLGEHSSLSKTTYI